MKLAGVLFEKRMIGLGKGEVGRRALDCSIFNYVFILSYGLNAKKISAVTSYFHHTAELDPSNYFKARPQRKCR